MDRTIETERLELRVPVAADLAAVAMLWKDPELVKFIGRRPLSREQAWQRLQRNVGHWALAGYGVFVVIERTTGQYVGEVGIANFERDVVPPIGKFEMGWIISPLVQQLPKLWELMHHYGMTTLELNPIRMRADRGGRLTPVACDFKCGFDRDDPRMERLGLPETLFTEDISEFENEINQLRTYQGQSDVYVTNPKGTVLALTFGGGANSLTCCSPHSRMCAACPDPTH